MSETAQVPLPERLREPPRLWIVAAMIALASALLMVDSFLKAMGPGGTDFLAFWGAGRLVAGGDPAAAYDFVAQQLVQSATGSSGWFAFVNPPPFLFLAAPLGTLPLPQAWIAWVLAGWGAWALVAVRAFPRLWLLVPVFPGALIAAGHAQTGFVTGALLLGGVVLLDRRPLARGCCWARSSSSRIWPCSSRCGSRCGRQLARLLRRDGSAPARLLVLAGAVFGLDTIRAYPAAWKASAAILARRGPDLYLRMASPYSQFCLLMPKLAALALHRRDRTGRGGAGCGGLAAIRPGCAWPPAR